MRKFRPADQWRLKDQIYEWRNQKINTNQTNNSIARLQKQWVNAYTQGKEQQIKTFKTQTWDEE